MKKLNILLLLVSLSIICYSQEEKRSKAYDLYKDGDLEGAKILIDEVCKHPETMNHPKSWYFKGLVYMEIAKNNKGTELSYHPGETAYKAILRSQELDEKGIYAEENKNELLGLSTLFLNIGSVYYNEAIGSDNNAMYAKTLREFESFFDVLKSLGSDSLQVIAFLDNNKMPYTDLLVFAGYSAYKSGNNEKAKKYYGQLTAYNKETLEYDKVGIPYAFITYCKILNEEGNHSEAVRIIDKAMSIWPDSKDMAMAELKAYQDAGDVDALMGKYEKAVVNDPGNEKLLAILAEKYDKIHQYYKNKGETEKAEKYRDEAIDSYRKVIKLNKGDEDFRFNLLYNFGILFYNPAVDLYNQSIRVQQDLRGPYEEKYTPLFNEALASFESAFALRDTDKNLIDMLTRIYLILDDMDKATEMKEKYKSLE